MRLATFNLKHGAYADGYMGHPKAVAEACAELDADILALQEVDSRVPRSKFANLARLAARASGVDKPIFYKTMNFNIGSYGNALIIRGKVDIERHLPLKGDSRFHLSVGGLAIPPFGYEPRNAILAKTHIGERQISIAATHLSTDLALGEQQLADIMAQFDGTENPQILLGDLNRTRVELLATHLLDTFEIAKSSATFPAYNPKRQIDHIAVKGLEICTVESRQMPISDHLALVVDVE